MNRLNIAAALIALSLTACNGGSDDEGGASADECRTQPYRLTDKPTGYYANCYVARWGVWYNRYTYNDVPSSPFAVEGSNHRAHP